MCLSKFWFTDGRLCRSASVSYGAAYTLYVIFLSRNRFNHGRIRHWGKWGNFPYQDSEAQNLLGKGRKAMNAHPDGKMGIRLQRSALVKLTNEQTMQGQAVYRQRRYIC